jgi:hypothetical protein
LTTSEDGLITLNIHLETTTDLTPAMGGQIILPDMIRIHGFSINLIIQDILSSTLQK